MNQAGTTEVVARVSDASFGRPLVMNVLRGQVVEAIVSFALEPEWKWCAADYASWDFERKDGLKLEVKQSARAQSWVPPAHGRANPTFDIRARTGRWEGAVFVTEPGRAADLYIFAWNDFGPERADHRDPAQWEFYVIPTEILPDQKRIGLASVKRLAHSVRIGQLRDVVASYCN